MHGEREDSWAVSPAVSGWKASHAVVCKRHPMPAAVKAERLTEQRCVRRRGVTALAVSVCPLQNRHKTQTRAMVASSCPDTCALRVCTPVVVYLYSHIYASYLHAYELYAQQVGNTGTFNQESFLEESGRGKRQQD